VKRAAGPRRSVACYADPLTLGDPDLAEKHQVKILESLRRRAKTSA
jgi:hypothetical protein